MKILIAPNAFKESLGAAEAAGAMARGLRRAARSLGVDGPELILLPIADGGDGTAEVLRGAFHGRRARNSVAGPLGERVRAEYSLLAGHAADFPKTAVIELAAASGLWRVPPARRNPLTTTTRGTGELIALALARGARRIILTLGGSATVDGGLGIAQALGFQLLDGNGRAIHEGGAVLSRLHAIGPPADLERLQAVEWIVLVDVDNPLLGARGAAAIFGPQKGATPGMVKQLEAGLANQAALIKSISGRDVTRIKGSGAAGGVCTVLAGLLGARVLPGADWILDALDFDRKLDGADWLITGEGKLDAQSLQGKAPVAAARRARRRGVPVVGLAGAITAGDAALAKTGFTATFPLCAGPGSREESIRRARPLLERIAFQVGRILFFPA